MNVFQALVLGLVQGFTEFLPVSSSGHLVLLQNLFNIDLGGSDMFYDIVLHLGTLIAVCAMFYKQIIALFRRPFKNLLYLIAATVPAAAAGIFLGDWVERTFFGGAYLAAGFALSAALLAAAQIRARRSEGTLPLKFRCAAAMGLAQAVAVLPGLSRSGTTVAVGILAGGEKKSVADFSFLMSIPVILGGFAVTLFKGLSSGELAQTFTLAGGGLGVCVAVSIAASAGAGFAAIKIMIKAVGKGRYTPFIIYLVVLAVLCAVFKVVGLM